MIVKHKNRNVIPLINKMNIRFINNPSEQEELPSEYQQVEYIGVETLGAYIATDIIATDKTKASAKFEKTNGNTIFGYGKNGANNNFHITGNAASDITARRGNSSVQLIAEYPVSVKMNNKLYVNGEIKKDFGNKAFETDYGIGIFARRTPSGGFDDKATGKLYFLKLYEDEVLIASFVPCYRIADNVIGLYDTIAGTFYDNDGTGTFTKGNNV